MASRKISGPAIVEMLTQGAIEARRVLIKQGTDIARRHLGHRLGAKTDQAQFRAVMIGFIGRDGTPIGNDRILRLAQLFPYIAELEPGRGKAGASSTA